MELLTADAIVLDVVDLQEYDRIVTLLTRERGKVRGVARGARRKYSRFAGQLQPLAKVRVTWFQKENRDLARISAVELERSAHRLTADLEGILLAGYLAEHLVEFAQENEESDHLFRLLDSTVAALLAGVDRQLATRYFEAWVLRLSGIFPAPKACPVCGRDLDSGALLPVAGEALLCRQCSGPGGTHVGPETIEFLIRIGKEALPRLATRPPSEATLEESGRVCEVIRRGFLHHELRSHQVMRETLCDPSSS